MTEVFTREIVLSRIGDIIVKVTGARNATIVETTRADDVGGWDSLNHVQIILAVEKEFNFRFKAVEVAQLENVGSLVDLVIARRGS